MMNITRRLFLLVREEARMRVIERLRYPVGLAGSLIFLLFVYGALFGLRLMLGGDGIAASPAQSGNEVLVGLLFWIVIAGSATRIAEMFGSRFDDGIIELMMLSRIPFECLIGLRVFQTLTFTTIFLTATLLPYGLWQDAGSTFLSNVIPVAIITELAATGLGLAIGGMTLHLKKIGPVAGLVYAGSALAIVFAATRPAFEPLLPIVPIFGPVHILMSDEPSMSSAVWVAMLISATTTFMLGAAVFRYFVKRARKRGTIYLT